MQQLFLGLLHFRENKIVSTSLLILTLFISQVTLAYDLEGYKNLPTQTNKTVKSVGNPMTRDEGPGCECNCINDKWVCTGSGCNLNGAACGGGIESSGVDLNSRNIPAISQPSVTTPARQINPQSLPGDQFDLKKTPGK